MTLINEIQRLSGGTEAEACYIFDQLTQTHLKKGKFLLRAGQICQTYYFIDSGAVRIYHIKDKKDYTVWIGTRGQIFTDLDSYLYQKPTLMNIQAIENSHVFFISKNNSDSLAKEYPPYNTLLRKTVEEAFAAMSRNIVSFQSDTAKDRYRRLESEKDWLLKFPLKYISTFIGVTQSTLSRLRDYKK